jgi:hypothetical protein
MNTSSTWIVAGSAPGLRRLGTWAQGEHHPVMRDACVDVARATEQPDPGFGLRLVAGDDLRAAMREHRLRHPLAVAPRELSPDGGMPESSPPSPPHDGAHHGRTVADVEAHTAERLGALRDCEDVRRVEDAHAAGADPVSHGRRPD